MVERHIDGSAVKEHKVDGISMHDEPRVLTFTTAVAQPKQSGCQPRIERVLFALRLLRKQPTTIQKMQPFTSNV